MAFASNYAGNGPTAAGCGAGTPAVGRTVQFTDQIDRLLKS
jgi:hypothetical protein